MSYRVPYPVLFLATLAFGCGNSSGGGGALSNEQPSTTATMPGGSVSDDPSSTTSTPPPATTPAPTNLPGGGGQGGTPAVSSGGAGGQAGGQGGMPAVPSGGAGGQGGASEVPAAGGAPVVPEPVERELLSQTGLYSDTAAGVLAEGVMPYSPQFELWTDGAEKRRWVYIPPGEQINTANVDEWKFPVGTKLWKEFSRDGVRVETRLVEKLPPERADEGFEGWLVLAYIWNDDQTDAVAAPDGAADAKGTPHDVPNQEACGKCHDMRTEKPLGFSAVQLAHDGEGATLTSLEAAGFFSTPITADLTVPGDEAERALLGYFHANCGHCHRARSPTNSRVSTLRLWLESGSLASFEETEMYKALVNHATESGQGSIYESRVVGGDPDNSELMRRVSLRATSPEIIELGGESGDVPMPPLGTEVVDTAAIELVRNWILALPPPEPAATP